MGIFQLSKISCEQYDYFEIACLFHYQVRLVFRNGQSVCGQAKNLESDKCSGEYLLITLSDGKVERAELANLKSMQVLTPKARFSEIVLS